MKLSEGILNFYRNLEIPSFLPGGVEILNPLRNQGVEGYMESFYSKYFADERARVMLIGINPGRFGGGLTGIPFTDPVNLEKECGITNNLEKRYELSSRFVYEMISALGGAERFYSRFYITAVSPIGFVRNGKNLNYYDVPDLAEKWGPFMIKTLRDQVAICGNRTVGISLGQGKNFKFLQKWNTEQHLFDEVKALPHPRWIMQYRLKRKGEFIKMYQKVLGEYLL